jgi:hypothetical protein
MTPEQMHQHFLKELVHSQQGVAAVAAHFIRKARLDVRVDHIHIPATYEEGRPDRADLWVRRPSEEWKLIEVKRYSKTVEFMLNKYPFIAVKACKAYDEMERKPDLFYILQEDMQQALVVNMDTAPPLKPLLLKDPRRGTCTMTYHIKQDAFQVVTL